MSDELALASAPDPTWRLLSPASRAPTLISSASQAAEIRDEIRHRRALYPSLVKKGALERGVADREIAIFVVLAEELAAGETVESRFTWFDKVHSLRREINLRRNYYPRQIAKGQLTHEDAQHRLELIEAAHHRYWIDGFASDDPRLLAPRPTRDQFPAGLMGNLAYAHAVVRRSAGRTAFFEEREQWVADQAAEHAAA